MNTSIYFLTDCHFKKDSCPDSTLILPLSSIISNDKNQSIILAVAGDLAFGGKADEYEIFKIFVEQLKINSKRHIDIVMCPGNHDISYNSGEQYTLETSIRESRESEKNEAIIKNRISKMENFYSFVKEMNVSSTQLNPFLSRCVLEDNESKIVFYSLNNAAFSCFCKNNTSDDIYGKLFLPKKYLDSIKKGGLNETVVLLMHYPLNYFDLKNRDELRSVINNNVDIVFTGHRHNEETSNEEDVYNVSYFLGDAFFDNSDELKSGFIKIDLSTKTHKKFVWDKNFYLEDEEKPLKLSDFMKNSLDLKKNNEYFDASKKITILGKSLLLDNIFVFPYISVKKYKDIDNEYEIFDFSTFDFYRKKNKITVVYGEEKYGKTVLATQLFNYYFNNNYAPLLCNWSDIENAPSLDSLLRNNIKKVYENQKNAYSRFNNSIQKSERILLVDNCDYFSPALLEKFYDFFESIIIFSKQPTSNPVDKEKFYKGELILETNIEPMYKSKRKILMNKIYKELSSNGNNSAIAPESFVDQVERVLTGMQVDDCYDPLSLICITISAYEGTLSFENQFFSQVYQAKSLLLLDKNNKDGPDYQIDTVSRITSNLAYKLYINQLSTFTIDDIENSIKDLNAIYGDTHVNKNELFNLLKKSYIIRENGGKLAFFNRGIFAFYVAKHINEMLEDELPNRDGFNYLLRQDLFSELHFNVLMCLSAIYNNAKIPTIVMEKLINDSSNQKSISISDIDWTKDWAEKIKQLSTLDRKDVDKINEQSAKIEKENRDEYLKNRDDFYYVEKMPEPVKDIVEWMNKLKIACTLMRNFSGGLKIENKKKLTELVLSIPNIVINKFNIYLFKELDEFYANYCLTNKNASETIDKLKKFIYDTKRAVILSIYDFSGRSFTNKATIDFLRDSLKERQKNNDDPLYIVQSLMYLSFSSKQGDKFVEDCSSLIERDGEQYDPFISSCAKLIGRQFIVRNYDYCAEHKRSFINKVFGKNKQNLLTIKNKYEKNK